jgi:acyl-CoA reductase-like NAD-dependent aldehyde dehydrogenase
MKNHKMWIGGKWVEAKSGKTFPVYNPATGEEIAQIPLGDKTDVEIAVAAARKAFPVWAGKSPEERSQILYRIADAIKAHKDELIELEVIDHGTPLKVARGMISGAPGMFEYVAQVSRSIMGNVLPPGPGALFYLQHEPRGVCALIVPWNAPFMGTCIKLSASLATGNACIIKPPSICSLEALKLAEILEKLDLPAGLVNIVTGPGNTVGEALSSHPDVNMVSFTGSCETGKRIMSLAANTVKRVQLELGGKNPFIVLEDADLDAAVARAVVVSFFNTGMVCSAPGRYYIHETLYDKFIDKFVAGAKKVITGDPADDRTDMGPVVSAEHRNRVEGYIKAGVIEGAKLVLGGKRPATAPLDKGFFIMPAVFTNVTQNMKIAREEIFGPVGVFLKFSSDDEVIGFANDTTFGLAASVWTKNAPRGIRLANKIQAGTVWINDHQKGGIDIPWGGYKESGFGKEKSWLGLEEYTQLKVISIDLTR